MPEFAPADLERWSQGSWSQRPDTTITSVGHDTRNLKPGALYVALEGERVDGHDLIDEAMQQGAVAALCREGRAQAGVSCLEVKDPQEALGLMANGHRKRCSARIIGITGSAGKTTAKDFLSAMCRAAGPTCATPGNWNNFIGLPLSILRMETDDQFGVFEMGMNHQGEIRRLAAILEPEMGFITSIGEAHLEQLGSVAAIAGEKTSLFPCLPDDGLCVIDLDSDWRDLMRRQCRSRCLSCSLYEDADVVGHRVPEDATLLRVEDRTRGELWEIPVPLPGEHMRKNLLQAAILARECGVTSGQMREGLEQYAGSPHRWQEVQVESLWMINDAYNANPLSMKCALRAFAEEAGDRPAWAVLGEMAELGPESRSYHEQLGRFLDQVGLEGAIVVGGPGTWIAMGARRVRILAVDTVMDAVDTVMEEVPERAALLVKASRSVGLETLVDAIKERWRL
jgi:UDP-N-acetylmuramoyl-tripeptide--D-alanyl-D-alanine ligase